MSIDIFVKEFKEESWNQFVKICEKYTTGISESISSDNSIPEDIKKVLSYRLGKYSKEWLNKELPILKGIKPVDLLMTSEGVKALKGILLRMPD